MNVTQTHIEIGMKVLDFISTVEPRKNERIGTSNINLLKLLGLRTMYKK